MLEWSLIQRRDTTRLIYDILCTTGSGASRYHIINRVNLRFSQAETYISFLLDQGHLQLDLNDSGIKKYRLTSKGERLRDFLAEIQRELDGLFAHTLNRGLFSLNPILATERKDDYRLGYVVGSDLKET